MPSAPNVCEACGDPVSLCLSCADYVKAAATQETGMTDGNHALLVGNILGVFQRWDADNDTMLFNPEVATNEDGSYLNYFYVNRKSGRYRVTITPCD